jgi:hypothetical protein
MTLSRTVPLVLMLAVLPVWPAAAQFGGMPGMPGSGGMMSPGGGPGGQFGATPQPQQPPPACQQLVALRDETQKHGQALQAAGQKKAPPEELCKLFKAFLAAETKMVKGLEDQSATCGVPNEVLQQVRAGHIKAAQTSKQICEVAAQGPRPSGPSLSDALGTTPVVPDTTSTKKGQGTFDTLSGSPLAR